MLQDRTCKQCEVTFIGGPRAYYCPVCRAERQRRQSAEGKARERQGLTRPLGSTDTCERCHKPYTVNSGLQRFCPECQPEHNLEYDRKTALPFYHNNKDRINTARKVKRRKTSNICAWCGQEFDPSNGRTTCSADCKRQLANQHQREFQQRKKANRDAD